jgi:hypothetical protein
MGGLLARSQSPANLRARQIPTVDVEVLWAALHDPLFGLPAAAAFALAAARAHGAALLATATTCLFACLVLAHSGWARPAFVALDAARSGLRRKHKCVGGVPLGYLEANPERRAGDEGRRTVLLLHDAFGCKDDWHAFVAAMHTKYRTLARFLLPAELRNCAMAPN